MQLAGLTFGDMQNRVALSMDLTIGEDGLPTSESERTMVANALNDAISEVYGIHEFSWSRRERSFTIGTGSPNMVNSDPTRYALPQGAEGQPTSRVLFTTVGGGTSGSIYATNLRAVRDRLNENTSTGVPTFCAFHQPGIANLGSLSTWEMTVYPSPAAVYTVTATFEHRPAKFVMASERGPWGAECDSAIVEGAKRILARRGKLNERISIRDQDRIFAEAIAVAVQKDKDRHPRNSDIRYTPEPRGVTYSNTNFA